MAKELTRLDWAAACYAVAKKHPDWVDVTFSNFAAGVKAQAEFNSEMTARADLALSALYSALPKDKMSETMKEAVELARLRLIECPSLKGTEFVKDLIKEDK